MASLSIYLDRDDRPSDRKPYTQLTNCPQNDVRLRSTSPAPVCSNIIAASSAHLPHAVNRYLWIALRQFHNIDQLVVQQKQIRMNKTTKKLLHKCMFALTSIAIFALFV